MSQNFIETITPNDLEKKYAAPFGSIYGKVSHGISGTVFRQPNKDRKIPFCLSVKFIILLI